MYNRRLSPLIISLLMALAAAPLCRAQNPPQPLPMNLVSAAELTEQQVAQINAYVAFFGERLNTATTPGDVESARNALIAPLNQPNAQRLVSGVFRLQYSKAATPEMEKALNSQDLHRAVNALLVLSQLGEPRAADLVITQLAAGKPWQIRLQAASAMRVLLQGGAIDPKRVPALAKRVRDAAAREDNGLVVAHLLAAIDAATTTAEPADAAGVRTTLVEAMVAVADRAAGANQFAGPTLAAFAKELERLRPIYIRLPKSDQASLGRMLAPAMVKLLQHVLAHWDEAQADKDNVAIFIGACETSLQFINTPIGGPAAPQANLRTAWMAGDKAQFEEGVNAWLGMVNNPPYK